MLCIDPGETTGWSLWRGDKVLGGGQTPLWEFAHDFADAVEKDVGPLSQCNEACLRDGVNGDKNTGPIELVVYEVFALYPWKAKALSWDEFRTVQLIGAIKLICDRHDIPWIKQPAQIKERAVAAGAEEVFVRPLHENRHQNDSLMHGIWYNLTQRVEKAKVQNTKVQP